MNIALIAAPWESVPPRRYGGTQRVVAGLANTLVDHGHTVTLFASGDSHTKAQLASVWPRALYRDGISWDNFFLPALHTANAFERQAEFDLIHYHLDRRTEYIPALLAARFLRSPVLFTPHFTIDRSHADAKWRRMFLYHFRDLNFTSISHNQRCHLPPLNFLATVHNGVDMDTLPFVQQPGKFLVWLGRMTPTKGAATAIAIAKQLKQSLILAGKLDQFSQVETDYFAREVRPHIDGKQIRFIGEVTARQRSALFRKASVLLNPVQWEEPFGLVAAEAAAVGVPVVAFRRGALGEVVRSGVTGFLVKTVSQAVRAVPKAARLNRDQIRSYAEQHFSYERMTKEYEQVYMKLVGEVPRG